MIRRKGSYVCLAYETEEQSGDDEVFEQHDGDVVLYPVELSLQKQEILHQSYV